MTTIEAIHAIKTLIKDDIDECCEASMDKECVIDKLTKIQKFLEDLDAKQNPKDLNSPFGGYY